MDWTLAAWAACGGISFLLALGVGFDIKDRQISRFVGRMYDDE